MNVSRQFLRLVLGIVTAAGWICIFTPVASYFVSPVTESIDPARIVSGAGNSYIIPLTFKAEHPLFFEIRIDHIFGPWTSSLRIFEDGKALGPPHSVHSEILEKGSGRYSHWGNSAESVVNFSTTDNSDPRTNGRKYIISAQPEFSPLVVSLIVIAALSSTLFMMRRISLPWTSATLAVAALASMSWIWLYLGRVSVTEDSATYISWHRIVPLGYPMFLSAIKNVTGSLRWTSVIQVGLLISACVLLALQVRDLLGRKATGFAVLVVLLMYTPMFSAEQALMSEAVFVPLVLINIAAALSLIREPTVKYAILLSLSAALIMFVRPAGYYAVLGPIFLVIAARSRLWWLRWTTMPMVLFAAISVLANLQVRGSGSQSQVGRVLFPHAAFLLDPEFVTGPDKEYALLVYEVLAPRRAGYQSNSSLSARFNYLLNDYNPKLLATDAVISSRLGFEYDRLGSGQDKYAFMFRRIEEIYLTLFLSAVSHQPLPYLGLIADQLNGAWQNTILYDYGRFNQIYSLAAANNHPAQVELIEKWKLPLSQEDVRLNANLLERFPGRFIEALDTAYRNIRSQRFLVYAIGIVTLIAIPIGGLFRRQSRHWLALGYCGVMIHGSMFLTAGVTVFISRYALPVDPVILVAGVIMADGGLSWGWTRMRKLEATPILADLVKRIGFKDPRAVGDRTAS